MKKIFTILALGLLVIGCNQEEIDQLTNENQQLDADKIKADSLLSLSMEYFNKIHANLQSIKEKEGIITISAEENVELQESQKDQILEDIVLINDLMVSNKNKIEELEKELSRVQNKLNAKGKQYAAALKQIEELKALISNYELLVTEKEGHIVDLKAKLVQKDLEIEKLNVVSAELASTIQDKTSELNTAWYAIGSKKELKEKQVISKDGGLLGIGSSKKLMDDFNKEYFTQIDITEVKEIPLFAKKADLVTSHPTGSYKIEGADGAADKIVITDAEAFWGASKYLVVVVN